MIPGGGETSDSGSQPRAQFGLGALLGCFVAVAMALAYLQRFNSPAVFGNGAIVFIMAALLGAVVGRAVKRTGEAIFWSVIISAAGYLSVVGELRYGVAFHYAWSSVGATSGAAVAMIPAGKLGRRMTVGGLAGGATMLIFFVCFSHRAGWELDLLFAPIVGALVGVLVEIIMWLEARSRMPRFVTASWLLCAVIIGNLLVPLAIG